MKTLLTVTGLALGIAALSGCQHHHHAESGLLKVGAPARAQDFSALDRFKALEGRWESDGDGDGKTGGAGDGALEYRVVAAGSAVEERLFPGSPYEMVTMYFTHYGDLYATHYCAGKNAPTMRGHWHERTSTWHFEHVSTTNADPNTTGVMGEMMYTFVDADTLKTSWATVKAGKNLGDGHGGVFKRVAAKR